VGKYKSNLKNSIEVSIQNNFATEEKRRKKEEEKKGRKKIGDGSVPATWKVNTINCQTLVQKLSPS